MDRARSPTTAGAISSANRRRGGVCVLGRLDDEEGSVL